jgi:hypothetical protein
MVLSTVHLLVLSSSCGSTQIVWRWQNRSQRLNVLPTYLSIRKGIRAPAMLGKTGSREMPSTRNNHACITRQNKGRVTYDDQYFRAHQIRTPSMMPVNVMQRSANASIVGP